MTRTRFAVFALRCRIRSCFALGMVFALLAGTANGEDARKPRTDLYGDPLPPGAVARLGTIRLRHPGAEIAFSADGKRLISCDRLDEIRIWDAATGRRVSQNPLPSQRELFEGNNHLITLSPVGSTAARWDGHTTVSIRDTQTGKERGQIPSITFIRNDLFVTTFSPDGKFLAVQTAGEGRENVTQIWDVATVKKCQTLKTPPGGKLVNVAFTWDGKRLAGIAAKSDGSGKLGGVLFDLFLWDTTTGKLIGKRENLRRMYAHSLAFSPDGQTLAIGTINESAVRLFEATTLKDKGRLKPPANIFPSYIDQLTFSRDGRWLAAAYGENPFNQPSQYCVLIWDLAGAKETRRIPARYGTRLAFSPDGRTLACHDNEASEIRVASEIRLYDAASGQSLHPRPGHDCPVQALTVSPDGKVVASGDSDGVMRLWDAATSKQVSMLEGRPLEIASCFFSLDSKRLVSVGKADLGGPQVFDTRFIFQLWDVAAGKALRRVEMKEVGVPLYAAAMSADGKRLATIVSGEKDPPAHLILWDLATGKRLSQRPYKFEVRIPTEAERNNAAETTVHASFTPDGERMTVWLGDRVGLEEVATGCLLAELPRNVGAPLVFAPDGRLMAAALCKPRKGLRYVGDLKGLSLIETASGKEVLRLEIGEFEHIAFTADGRGVIVEDSEGLCVRDTETGDKLYQMTWPERIARTVNDTGDRLMISLVALPGGRVATGMVEGDILVWDLAASTWPVRRPASDLNPMKLDGLWSDLASDARKAHQAMGVLAAAPAQVVPFLKEHLQSATVDDKCIKKLLADLDSDSFAVRETALRDLTRLHYRIEVVLQRALKGQPSLEMRRRLQAILAGPKYPSSEDLRTLRAIAVLERIGTPEARRILEKLSVGVAAPETREAKASLERLKRR